MYKIMLILFSTILGNFSAAQKPDSAGPVNKKTAEILNSGFIDLMNNGQVNASARFVRLFIGEPGRWAIPLSVYSGVSANNFQNSPGAGNEQLLNNFINPLSGLANVSVDGVFFIFSKAGRFTKTGFLYHFGERVLTGFKTGSPGNLQTGKAVNFLNSFFSSGLYAQTGAWERNNAKSRGLTWLTLRWIGCYTNKKSLREFLPAIQTNGFYHGYSIGWGIEINNLINLKILYYKYIHPPEADYILPIYQFSFQYSLKN